MDAQRAFLEGQVEAAKRAARHAQEARQAIEGDMQLVKERALAKESQLQAELRKTKASHADAMAREVAEKAQMAVKLRELQQQLEEQRLEHNAVVEGLRAELSSKLSALPGELISRAKEQAAGDLAADDLKQQLEEQHKAAAEAAARERAAHVANLKAQGAYLLEAERRRCRELEGKLASSCIEAAAVREEAAVVWEFAQALVALVEALEGWHYPVTQKSGVRCFHIPATDKPAAVETERIPYLRAQLKLTQRYLGLLGAPAPPAPQNAPEETPTGFMSLSHSRPSSARPATAPGSSRWSNVGSCSTSGRPVSPTRHQPHWQVVGRATSASPASSPSLDRGEGKEPLVTGHLSPQHKGKLQRPHTAGGFPRSDAPVQPAGISVGGQLHIQGRATASEGGAPSPSHQQQRDQMQQQQREQRQREQQQRQQQHQEQREQLQMQQLAQVPAEIVQRLKRQWEAEFKDTLRKQVEAAPTNEDGAPASAVDAAALVEHAANLEEQLDSCRQELLAERKHAQELQVALRSAQRSQQEAAGSYLAGLTEPISPPPTWVTAYGAHVPSPPNSRPSSAPIGGSRKMGLSGTGSISRPGSSLGIRPDSRTGKSSMLGASADFQLGRVLAG